MAISYVNGASANAATLTYPTGIQAGDAIVFFAYRTALTAPSLGTGFQNITNGSANVNSYRIAVKFATGTESGTASPAFTNATDVTCLVYRGVGGVGGKGSTTAASGTTNSMTSVTMSDASGNAWIVGFFGSAQATSSSTPVGTTLRDTRTATGSQVIGVDSNGGVSSWASGKSSTLGTAAVSASADVELIPSAAAPTQYIQSKYGTGGVTTLTFATTPTVGNYVLAAFTQGATVVTAAPTDNKGNTWSTLGSANDTTNSNIAQLFYAPVTATGTTFTVTFPVTDASIVIAEISGVTTPGTPVTGAAASGQPTVSLTTTAANSLVVYIEYDGGASNNMQAGYETEYTMQRQPDNSANERLMFGIGQFATAGAQSIGLLAGYGASYAIVAAEFPLSSGVTTPTGLFFQFF